MRAVQLGTMYSSITLIRSSPLIFRPGSTVKSAMTPETITPRVVAVGDAANRSGVSSSSSASVFEVLRDSQIHGSDKLKAT